MDARPGEADFLRHYDRSAYPIIQVTVDVVLLHGSGDSREVLLVRRAGHPFRDHWALPGGFLDPDEDLETAALRELFEETGVVLQPGSLAQFRAYGAPGRDPRGRTVTIVFATSLETKPEVRGGDDAAEARFWRVEDLDLDTGSATTGGPAIAFDHHRIIADALR